MPSTSLIDIVDGGSNSLLGDYAIRQASIELSPIDASKQLRRTVNGDLVDLSYSAFHKYAAKITCADQEAPLLANIFPGTQLTVTCLDQTIGPDLITMTMRVVDFKSSRDEYGVTTSWELDLEQI